jgi:hypothetical protein
LSHDPGPELSSSEERNARHHGPRIAVVDEPPFIRASIVVLGLVVLTCVGLLVPPLWTAALKVWPFNAQECSLLKQPLATCNQELNIRPLRMPAKGG